MDTHIVICSLTHCRGQRITSTMVARGHEILSENKTCQISLHWKKNFCGDCRLRSPHHSCCGVDSDVAYYFCLCFSILAMHYMWCSICYNKGTDHFRLYALSTLEHRIKLLHTKPIKGHLYWINFNNTVPHRSQKACEETSVTYINKPEPVLIAGYDWFQAHIPFMWD